MKYFYITSIISALMLICSTVLAAMTKDLGVFAFTIIIVLILEVIGMMADSEI